MGYPLACARCGTTELLRIPGSRVQRFPVVRVGTFGVVPLARYVCSACGCVEHWVDDPKNLDKIRRSYPFRKKV